MTQNDWIEDVMNAHRSNGYNTWLAIYSLLFFSQIKLNGNHLWVEWRMNDGKCC